ncbi:hypothetical protein PAHAL_4G003000 [Panicum hallii]|nr:hypothetical protein PAHAL_4G003000 [Panicum hallii]
MLIVSNKARFHPKNSSDLSMDNMQLKISQNKLPCTTAVVEVKNSKSRNQNRKTTLQAKQRTPST